MTLTARAAAFWECLEPEPNTGCFLWIGSDRKGYGRVWWNGVYRTAHRLAWELKNGPIPPGVLILHRCDNPPCCNEVHLFRGSHSLNLIDCFSKGRRPVRRGDRHPMARITEEVVIAIRSARRSGETLTSIAQRVGISPASASMIAAGKRWGHVVHV